MAKNQRLKRSRTDVMLAGVCAGIADHFDSDPTLVRVLAVLIALVTGIVPALIAYLVLAIIVPQG